MRTIAAAVLGAWAISRWLGFRRVIKVNGKAIADRGVPLAQLMAEGASDDYDQARLLLAGSAGTANYTNYRRFQASGRVVPPPPSMASGR